MKRSRKQRKHEVIHKDHESSHNRRSIAITTAVPNVSIADSFFVREFKKEAEEEEEEEE